MQVETIAAFKLHGEIIQPGTVLEIPLEAFEKLKGKVAAVHPETAKLICYCCKSTDFWLSIHGRMICRKCHPPAPGAEVMK